MAYLPAHETLAEIASEKAGIIKPGVPVVSGVTGNAPRDVIAEVAKQHGCRLIEVGKQYHYRDTMPNHWSLPLVDRPTGYVLDFTGTISGEEQQYRGVQLGLLGHHQAANAAVAIATLCELQHQGWNISEPSIRTGLATVRMPARVEVFPGEPTVIVDTAHNEASAAALVEVVEQHAPHPRTLVLSISRDKEVRAIVHELIPHIDCIVVTQFLENPRAVAIERLAHYVREVLEQCGHADRIVVECETPTAAWQYVSSEASAHELVCITGSFFLAAEMRRFVAAR